MGCRRPLAWLKDSEVADQRPLWSIVSLAPSEDGELAGVSSYHVYEVAHGYLPLSVGLLDEIVLVPRCD